MTGARPIKALLIGIADYGNVSSDLHDLPGARDDVARMKETLGRLGLAEDGLIDSPPRPRHRNWTRAAILEAFEALRKKVQPGDRVVIYYSGHADRLTTRKNPRKPFEAILACDFVDKDDPYNNTGDYRNYISDRELEDELEKFRENILLEVILDCCYASGMGEVDNRPGCFCPPEDRKHDCVLWTAAPATADIEEYRDRVSGRTRYRSPFTRSFCDEIETAWKKDAGKLPRRGELLSRIEAAISTTPRLESCVTDRRRLEASIVFDRIPAEGVLKQVSGE